MVNEAQCLVRSQPEASPGYMTMCKSCPVFHAVAQTLALARFSMQASLCTLEILQTCCLFCAVTSLDSTPMVSGVQHTCEVAIGALSTAVMEGAMVHVVRYLQQQLISPQLCSVQSEYYVIPLKSDV